MGPRLAVIVSKCPRLKNVYKFNGRSQKSPTTKRTKEGNNRRSSVYTLNKIICVCVCVCTTCVTYPMWTREQKMSTLCRILRRCVDLTQCFHELENLNFLILKKEAFLVYVVIRRKME